MRNILVLRGGALGDFIVTLPALALLRQRWPAARIELVGNATAAALAQHRGLIDAVHSQHESRWAAVFATAPLPPDFGAWLRQFDLVLNYWPDPDGDLRRRFPMREGQVFLSTAAMPTRAPAAAHYCTPLRELGLEPNAYFHRLSPLASMAAADAESSGAPRSGICLHPGSGSPRKNWPHAKWLELIAHLPEPVSVVLGEAELAAWGDFAPGSRLTYLTQRPLEELVSLFAGCRLFVGHDSGISHLAAAAGARCVLLFGPTASEMWAPPAPSVRVLQATPDLSSLPVPDVAAAVVAALGDQT